MRPLGAPKHFPWDRDCSRGRADKAARIALDEGLEAAEDQIYIDHIIAADLAEAREEERIP